MSLQEHVHVWHFLDWQLLNISVMELSSNQGKDILFFVDNIFRFTQAGSEVSAF
jgi:F0F1-type ATP synthase beta subunit